MYACRHFRLIAIRRATRPAYRTYACARRNRFCAYASSTRRVSLSFPFPFPLPCVYVYMCSARLEIIITRDKTLERTSKFSRERKRGRDELLLANSLGLIVRRILHGAALNRIEFIRTANKKTQWKHGYSTTVVAARAFRSKHYRVALSNGKLAKHVPRYRFEGELVSCGTKLV